MRKHGIYSPFGDFIVLIERLETKGRHFRCFKRSFAIFISRLFCTNTQFVELSLSAGVNALIGEICMELGQCPVQDTFPCRILACFRNRELHDQLRHVKVKACYANEDEANIALQRRTKRQFDEYSTFNVLESLVHYQNPDNLQELADGKGDMVQIGIYLLGSFLRCMLNYYYDVNF